ncbi:polysaccharide pyruvyl transferase family protein [Acinetobacter haemolyticus]|uniref:polysaccharide pyruvyl transferase family protein n=1 Tax=Acinetobacter haemolyticus TaxID=29430 RepID=UPI003F566437
MFNNKMLELKSALLKVLDFIEDKNDVVYLDYPLHFNIGDILILEGAISFFEKNDVKVKKYLNVLNLDISHLKKNITDKTTILCHGGGNFGDLYDIHQSMRENIVREFPDNRIIILPQTAFFSDIKQQEKSKKIFLTHNNVIMFARDLPTYELFKTFSDKTYLVPDMAHQLYQELSISEFVENKTLFFLRKDKEANILQKKIEIIDNGDIYDWEDLITQQDKKLYKRIKKVIKWNKFLGIGVLDDFVFRIWHKHSLILVNNFALKFSSYDKIVTSRLHGHILSCLIDKKSNIIDNSYGKNKAYYQLWTKDTGLASLMNED